MSSYPTIGVSPDVARAFAQGTPDDRIVLRVQPPQDGPGLDQGANLINSVHHVDVESSIFSETVNNKLCAFEMWYENEQLDFYFIVPDEEEEDHYRRQISGYYDGVQIHEETLKHNQFLNVESGRCIAATRLGASNHVFEPFWMIGQGGDDDSTSDPYQPILNEVDSKTNLGVVIQVVYEPLPDSWQTIGGENIRDFAHRLEEDGTLEERLFGLISRSLNNEQLQQQGAEAIRNQIDSPAFRMELRLAVVADDKTTATTELDALVDLFQTTYKGKTGQKLTPVHSSDAENLLSHMISRDMLGDGLPDGLLGNRKLGLFGTTPTIIASSPELAGFVHLPNRDDVSVSGVNYTEALVDGTLPPTARTFEPVTKSERKEAQKREQQETDAAR